MKAISKWRGVEWESDCPCGGLEFRVRSSSLSEIVGRMQRQHVHGENPSHLPHYRITHGKLWPQICLNWMENSISSSGLFLLLSWSAQALINYFQHCHCMLKAVFAWHGIPEILQWATVCFIGILRVCQGIKSSTHYKQSQISSKQWTGGRVGWNRNVETVDWSTFSCAPLSSHTNAMVWTEPIRITYGLTN